MKPQDHPDSLNSQRSDCVALTFVSKDSLFDLYKVMSGLLLDFSWRCGDSDAIGESTQ
jgi:hypothetical protein